jgi:hypothetical protein
VDTELEAYHKSNADLDKMIGSLRKDLDEFQEGAKNLRSTLSKRDDEIKSFSGKLFQTVSLAKEPKDWVAGAEALLCRPRSCKPSCGCRRHLRHSREREAKGAPRVALHRA